MKKSLICNLGVAYKNTAMYTAEAKHILVFQITAITAFIYFNRH